MPKERNKADGYREKAPIKREKSDVFIDSSEREVSRPKVKAYEGDTKAIHRVFAPLAYAASQRLLPHNRAWLCTCKQVPAPYEFYLREGFRPYKDEIVGPGQTWVYMEKKKRERL